MKILGLLILSLFLVSCGESHSTNHETEKGGLDDTPQLVISEGYRFAKLQHSFNVDWITGPLKGESKFILKTWNDKQGTLNGPYQDLPETLNVFIWMPGMNHGSSPVKIRRIDQGEYEVSSVYFIMGGRWDLHVQVVRNNSVLDEVILPITL